jgi:Protein of unknown function (DUF4231)
VEGSIGVPSGLCLAARTPLPQPREGSSGGRHEGLTCGEKHTLRMEKRQFWAGASAHRPVQYAHARPLIWDPLIAVDSHDASAPPARSRRERDWLRQSWNELVALTHELDLEPRELRLLELRWLDEARHYEALWRRQRELHDVLGVVTIIAGLAAPLLVAVGAPDWALAAAGFVVAASSALVGFFRYGERWRHQRKTAMLLKAEGMRFLELRAPYDAYGSHRNAFPYFLNRLEGLNEAQSEEYLALWSLGAPSLGAENDERPGVAPR